MQEKDNEISFYLHIKDSGRSFPPLIGMTTEQIAKITLERLKPVLAEKLKELRQSGIHFQKRELHFFIFQDTFLPPSDEVLNILAKISITAFQLFSLKNQEVIVSTTDESVSVSFSPENPKSMQKLFSSSDAFRMRNPKDWARALNILQKIKNKELMEKGVFFISPDESFISLDSDIDEGTIIHKDVFIISSKIGRDSEIGQGVFLFGCKIHDRVKILPYSYLEGAEIDEDVSVGPFARMRPKVIVRKNSKIGNFAEIKNSEIGEGTKIQHFSYIGDAVIGKNVNIGAGTVTCNWDGRAKNRTEIEDGVFVGSGAMLVAPLKIEKFAYIGAGSTITKNVPPYSLSVERSEQKIIPDWTKRKFPDLVSEND
jgi:bifunctional UDP-N-acetylglucosamine pyrophosphorylase/glucosamine-1-phosphate N-acetyltransferase